MSEKKIRLWLSIDSLEKENYQYSATYKETLLGWLIQYTDHEGFSITLAKRNERIHLIKKGEWTIKAKYSLNETTELSIHSPEGEMRLELITSKVDFKEQGLDWQYSLVNQPDEFCFSYRWENINESN